MPMDSAMADNLDTSAEQPTVEPVENGTSEGDPTKEAIAEALAAVEKKAPKAPKAKPAAEPEPEEDAPAEEEPTAEEGAEQTEAEAEAEKQRAKEESEYAARFNKLAQQERKLIKEREETKGKVAEAEAKLRNITEKAGVLEAAIGLLETNPLRAFKLLGKSFEKSANRVVELSKNPQLAIQDELDAVKAETTRQIETERKRQEEEKRAERDQAAKQRQEQDWRETEQFINQRVADGGDAFELIRARGLENQIARDIYDNFQKTGEVVKYAEYLAFVESELEKEVEEKLLKTKKLAAKYKRIEAAEAEEEEAEAVEVEAPAPKPKPRTLTNSVTTRVAPKPGARKIREASSGDADMDAAMQRYLEKHG